MRLVTEDAYLFVPQISAIPMHLDELFRNRTIDLWLAWVYREFGGGALILTLAPLVALLALSADSVWRWTRAESVTPAAH
jgi:hypothetical protein